jgi:hypothetical protein
MKQLTLISLLAFLVLFGMAQSVNIPNPLGYPLPGALSAADSAKLGELIPHTMYLLHSGQKVKIAIYGQSLSDENNRWWRDLGDVLKLAYPNADIDIRTFGVGGVASSLLWRLTNQELVAFYPDLVIFHVYGHHTFYETIIRQIRGCTAAEMIIQGDHFGKNDGTGAAGSWNYNLNDMSKWDNNMSFQIVKDYCDTYKLERDNRRQEWYDYLRANSYVPAQLLKDDIHFNEQGQWLVASLAARHFVYNPGRNTDPSGLVKYYEVGKDVAVIDGKISLPFEGNKIELIPSSKTEAVISATIDGKKPSEFANCYYFTIASGGFWNGAPFLRPGMGIPQEEGWTITMTGNGNFSLSGSKTGFDGSGNKDNVFIAGSKRVVLIKKNDWGNYGSPNASGNYTFKSKGMFNEKIAFDTISFDPGKENAINLVQGLGNTTHTLELTSSNGIFPIRYIKIYKPAYKLKVDAPTVINIGTSGGTVIIPVKGNTFWQASHNSTRLGVLSQWNNIQLQNGEDFAIDDNTINISCTIPALTGINATEYVYIYGQGCDVKVVEIRQGIFTNAVKNEIPDEISVFPNPVKDTLHIVNLTEKAVALVYQLNGKLIKQQKLSNSAISLSDLPSGTYLLKIKSGKKAFSQTILKE